MDTEIGSKSDAARRLGCRQDWVRRGVELESSSTCDRELQRRESGRRTGVAPLGRRRRASTRMYERSGQTKKTRRRSRGSAALPPRIGSARGWELIVTGSDNEFEGVLA